MVLRSAIIGDWSSDRNHRGADAALAQRNFYFQKNRTRTRTWKTNWAVVLFLVGLSVPWVIPFGPLHLTIYALVLLTFLLPCIWKWMRGATGGISLPEFGLFFYCIWAGIALLAAHGFDAIQTVGILFIETMGAYLLARCFIRDAADFRGMVLVATTVVL